VLEKTAAAEETAKNTQTYDDIYYPQVFFRLPGEKSFYAFYDIDSNGVSELIIGKTSDAGYENIYNIWGLNGKTPVRLFEGFEGWRDVCWILKNGIILNEGTGGADIKGFDFYQIMPDGYSVDFENGFEVESVYGSAPIITHTTQNNTKITPAEYEEIMNYYGIDPFPFVYADLETVKLNWKKVIDK
jgi:hypothetical protein